MSGAFRHKLNLKNNLEIFCNYVLVTVRISVLLFNCNFPTLLRFQIFILSVHMVFVYILLQHGCIISETLSRDLILKWWCRILDTIKILISLFNCNLPTLLRFWLFILSVYMVFVYIPLQTWLYNLIDVVQRFD